MPTIITNIGNKPLTLPLRPPAMVGPGRRVVYSALEPDAIIEALGGGEIVRQMNLDVKPIDALLAPADLGLCRISFGVNQPVDVLPDPGTLDAATLTALRGAHFFLRGSNGNPDAEYVLIADGIGGYALKLLSFA